MNILVENEKNTIPCNFCNLNFSSLKSLSIHARWHKQGAGKIKKNMKKNMKIAWITRKEKFGKCGCKNPIKKNKKISLSQTGVKESLNTKLKLSRLRSGKGNSRWKGGNRFYYMRKARKLMEVTEKNIVVHHRDRNWKNNNLNNLLVLTREDHTLLHKGARKRWVAKNDK